MLKKINILKLKELYIHSLLKFGYQNVWKT